MRKRLKMVIMLVMVCCMLFGSISVSAADELLGTVVDGSLLTDSTEVHYTVTPKARGVYLADGEGNLSLAAYRTLSMFGSTSCYQYVDKVKVTLYLQRLENGTWTTVSTLGPRTAYNDYYVSNSNSYSVAGGYYYRVYGGHSAIEGSKSEALTSYSDGFWVE